MKFKKVNKVDNERRLIAARQLLETPMFIELLEAMENRYFEAWYNSKQEDKELREKSFIQLQTIKELKDYLQNILKHDKLKN
jgi:hypothetical protein